MTSSLSLLLLAGAALTAQNNVVLLDFSADWCGPCRQMAPIVSRLEREGYPVREVDVDQEPEMAKRYGIQGIPAFVLVRDGREVERVVGTTTAAHLKQLLDGAGAGPTRSTPSRMQSRSSGRAVDEATPVIPVKSSAPGRLPIQQAISTPSRSASEPDAMGASVRVRVRENGASAYGSGTIIYSTSREAVVLTCGHIFRASGRQGEVLVDLYEGPLHTTASGEVIAFDLEADVGLVRIETDRELPSMPVAPRSYALRPGAGVASIGCSGGAAPTAEQGEITAVNRYLGPANTECSGLPVQGRSGGGLFSEDGYVIGVCSAADPSEGRGLYAGLAEVHEELESAGLAALIAPGGEALAQGSPSRGSREPAETSGSSLSESEVLAEIAGQFEEAEVVCVIRSLKDARAKSRVIVLDRASTEFLAQLDRERVVQDSRHLTSLRKADRPASRLVLRVEDMVERRDAASQGGDDRTSTAGNSPSVPLAGRRVFLSREPDFADRNR